MNTFYINVILVSKKLINNQSNRLGITVSCSFILLHVINETWSTDKILKNANFLQQGTGKNLTTPLYSQTTKPEIFFDEKGYKNGKITKPSHAYKVCLSTHSVEILNSFNPELQLKGTAFVIRKKLKKLFTELRGF